MKALKFLVLLALVSLFLGACNGINTNNSTNKVNNLSASPVLDRIATRGELIVGTAGNMPPLNMTTKDGKVIGIDIDLAKYIAGNMDVKLTIKTMPFHELLSALKAGKIDMVISGMTITGLRNREFAFVGPYFLSGKSILTKDTNIALLDSGDELNNPDISLVALKGSTSQQVIEDILPKAKMVLADKYGDAVKTVLDGKVNAMVADYPICLISVARFPDYNLMSLVKPFTYEPLGIAVQSGDPLLVNWLENFMNSYKGSGELENTTNRWLKNTAWIKLLPPIE